MGQVHGGFAPDERQARSTAQKGMFVFMPFLYETHLHTAQSSTCGRCAGRDYIKRYLELGYAGIIVTDHFYHGNTGIDRHLPWREWVEGFCRGYEEAREEGERQGLDVFFGWEEHFDDDEYLVYGLDKAWLLEHPEVTRWSRPQQLAEVHRYGGCVVQAHPFRGRSSYMRHIRLAPECADAAEVANAGNTPNDDALAYRYAQKLGLVMTAGSDSHYTEGREDDDYYGVYLNERMTDIADYVRAVREGDIAGLRVPQGRGEWTGREEPVLPAELLDAEGKATRQNVRALVGG